MENRRSFLTRAALGAAAAGVSKAPAATDQLVVGFIGTGTRAQHALIPQFKFNTAFRIAAVCDVYQPNMEAAAKVAASNPDMYGDYRRILERKDIDVVVIATPDHWHCPIAIEACSAGKDIYLEKPVSNDIDMCMKAVAAAREHKRVVQVGLMQRSSAPFMEAYKVIQSGVLGNVRHAMVVNPGGGGGFGGGRGGAGRGAAGAAAGPGRGAPDALVGQYAGAGAGRGAPGAGGGRMAMSADSSTPPPGLDWEMFQGPAPRRPYSSGRQRSWRSYWEYGGGPLSDWGVHLLDIVHWYLGVTAPLTRAAASYGWFSRPQDDRVPDTTEVSWQYPKFVADYSSRSDAQGTYIWGDRGMLFVNRQGYEVKPSGGGRGGGGGVEAKKVALHDEPPQGGAGFETDAGRHILNFLACIKSWEKPVCDIEIGAFSTIPTLMAGVSIRSGGKTVAWNGHGADVLG